MMQLAMCIWYYSNTWRLRSPPVPFWFPSTVGIGAYSIAGARVGLPQGLLLSGVVAAAFQCLVLWPWITWRLIQSTNNAAAPSVFVLGAPISLVGVSFYAAAGTIQ